MSYKSLRAAFTAAVLSVGIFGAHAQEVTTPPSPQPDISAPLKAAPKPASFNLGDVLPIKNGAVRLQRDKWYPVAMGMKAPTPANIGILPDGSRGLIPEWMMILRQEGSEKIRLADLTTNTIKITSEGDVISMTLPLPPHLNVSFPQTGENALPVQKIAEEGEDAKCVEPWQAEFRLVNKAGQDKIIEFVSSEGQLMDIYAGDKNPGQGWTILSRKAGDLKVCMETIGGKFMVGPGYLGGFQAAYSTAANADKKPPSEPFHSSLAPEVIKPTANAAPSGPRL